MALIQCQECKKEISDQSERCIHCGFPIKTASGVQQVEIAGVRMQSTSKKYVIVAVVLIVIASAFYFLQMKHRQFEGERLIAEHMVYMHVSHTLALGIQDTTYKTWKNAIESQKDFNVALQELSWENAIVEGKELLSGNLKKIDAVYTKLSQHESAFPALYSDFSNAYIKLKDVAKLALEPEGNLRSYAEETRKNSNDFERALQRLQVKITATPHQAFIDWLLYQYK